MAGNCDMGELNSVFCCMGTGKTLDYPQLSAHSCNGCTGVSLCH